MSISKQRQKTKCTPTKAAFLHEFNGSRGILRKWIGLLGRRFETYALNPLQCFLAFLPDGRLFAALAAGADFAAWAGGGVALAGCALGAGRPVVAAGGAALGTWAFLLPCAGEAGDASLPGMWGWAAAESECFCFPFLWGATAGGGGGGGGGSLMPAVSRISFISWGCDLILPSSCKAKI